MASPRAATGCGLAFAGFWMLFWSVATLIIDAAQLYTMAQQHAASSFDTVEGTVTESKVVEHFDSDGGKSYRARLLYGYHVAGRGYSSDRDRYSTTSAGWSSAKQIVQAHPVGSKVTVYYNPANPSDALLRPGIIAGDFFILLFMLPFNIIMLGSWVWAAKMLRGADKTPGGLRIVDSETELRARPAWSSPIVAAAAAALATSFVLIFVVGFTTGMEPSARAVAAAWSTVFAAAILAGVAASSGRRDMVLDRVRDTISLPAGFFRGAPAPVERSQFFAIELVDQTRTDSEGHSTKRYLPTLRWHGDDGQPAEAGVFPQPTKQRGEQVVAWLREIVLRQSSKEAQD